MAVASVSTGRHYCAVHRILRIFSRWQILADGGYAAWYMEFLCRIKDPMRRRVRIFFAKYTGCLHTWNPTLRHALTSEVVLLNLIILHFTRFNTSFHFLPFRAYCLGHFDIKVLFLLRSYYKTLQYDRAVVNQERL